MIHIWLWCNLISFNIIDIHPNFHYYLHKNDIRNGFIIGYLECLYLLVLLLCSCLCDLVLKECLHLNLRKMWCTLWECSKCKSNFSLEIVVNEENILNWILMVSYLFSVLLPNKLMTFTSKTFL